MLLKYGSHDLGSNDVDVTAFLNEALIMKDFNHPNVLTLIGITLDKGEFPMVILPFMQNGSLLSYIRNENNVGLMNVRQFDCTSDIIYDAEVVMVCWHRFSLLCLSLMFFLCWICFVFRWPISPAIRNISNENLQLHNNVKKLWRHIINKHKGCV